MHRNNASDYRLRLSVVAEHSQIAENQGDDRSGAYACFRKCVGEKPVTTVAAVLRSKIEKAIHTISPEASVFDAIKLMAERNIGALLVMAEGHKIAGIITERDYARKIVLMARSSKETPVRDVMSSPVMYVSPDRTSEECMALMTEHRLRHLAVMDGGQLLGIISIGDLVKDIISEQKFTIEQLEHYITG